MRFLDHKRSNCRQLLAGGLLLLGAGFASLSQAADKPNILVIDHSI